MTIVVDDLIFLKSERMTQNDDGGGRMTASVIQSGQVGEVFSRLSDVDRAAGSFDVAKVYGSVGSDTDDAYLDAGVVILKGPDDANITSVVFSTGDFYDERAAIVAQIEQSIVRGARWPGWLWGIHLKGMRAVTLWQRPETELPAVGARVFIAAYSSGAEQYSQYLWVTQVTDVLRTIIDGSGAFQVRQITLELAEPLDNPYTGIEPSRYDPTVSALAALIYDTRYNADAVALAGIQPTVAEATTSDFSIQVESLYVPIIPTALSETILADVTPGGDSPALIGSNDAVINFTTTLNCINPTATLYLGTAFYPGTLSIVVGAATITDDNGVARLGGVEIGTADYANGLIRWNASCPAYGTASKTVSFRPAGRPLTVVESAAVPVTVENRGYAWAITLSPIPAPRTLGIAYQVNGKWYVLRDQGGGALAGTDSAYGAGTLSFGTGTASWTAGALPDVGSQILYFWSVPTRFFSHGGAAVDAPVIRGQLAHGGIAPNTVSISWTVSGTTYTSSDIAGDGLLNGSGHGDGRLTYSTGEWWLRPTILPPKGTVFTISYQYGDPITETFTDPAADGGGLITLNLAHTNLLPRSISLHVPVTAAGFAAQANLPAGMIEGDAALETVNVVAEDDGAGSIGGLWVMGTTSAVGGAAYTAGWVSFNNQVTVGLKKPVYAQTLAGYQTQTDGSVTPVYHTVQTGWVSFAGVASFVSGTITVQYRTDNSNTSVTEEFTLDQIEFDLTRGYSEQIVLGATAFKIGTSRYVETAGAIYRDPAPDTGAGTLCGTLENSTGRVRLSSWPSGGANAVTIQSLLTTASFRPIEEVVFRTPISPISPGTWQIRGTTLDGTTISKTVPESGVLEDADCTIHADFPRGVMRARFGAWKVDSALSAVEKAEPWYSVDARVDFAGTLKIFKPKLLAAGSVFYSARAITTLPPDSALLGINAARLPPDGKALIYRVGMLALAHHTATMTESSLSPTQDIDCGRVRLYHVEIEDANELLLDPSQYTVNRETGHVVMSPTLDLTGYTAPYSLRHTVADLGRLVSTDINGLLTFNKQLSHDYPAGESFVSGVLYCGTLQARVSNLFEQASWDGVWSDALRGSAPLAQYSDALYPIAVTNAGAYPDRFLIKFTSATAFQVIGEQLGLIAVGDVNTDCAPVNSLTSKVYFTIDQRGWGSGWATGNCLRFNLVGAAYPADVIRAVQPSQPTGQKDNIRLLMIGNPDQDA